MFVEELERFAAEVSDPRCAAIAERLATPVTVAVTGCRGVGRGTVTRALARAGIAVTTPVTADLTVRVLADAAKPEDCAAIDDAGQPLLVVLNKADLIATTGPGRHPHGPTAAARARCAQLSERVGVSVEPMIGLLAVAELDDTVWAQLHGQRPLIPQLGTFGTRQAVAAIRRGASRTDVAALLRELSSIDAIVDKLAVLGGQPRYRRMVRAVAELEILAVTDHRIGDFLGRDDTVVARMMDAVDAAEAAGMDVDRGDSAADHLRRAVHWQRYRRSASAISQRACGADIVRGSLRLWSRAGGSG